MWISNIKVQKLELVYLLAKSLVFLPELLQELIKKLLDIIRLNLWLNEIDEDGNPVNYPWYTLGFDYGYDDWYYSSTDENGN